MSSTTNQPNNTGNDANIASALEALTNKLDALQTQLDAVRTFQQQQVEFIDEMTPIVRAVVDAGTERFQDLEDKGYFSFGREGIRVIDKVVEGFSAEDVRLLGDNIITIMETVRNLTQPDVLNVVNEVTEAFYHSDEHKQVGFYGMFKASKEKEVQKGFGVLLAILRSLGRGASGVRRSVNRTSERDKKRARISAKLAPKRRLEPKSESKVDTKDLKAATPTTEAPALEGFSADGFLLDPDTWTEELAVTTAAHLGIDELTEAHWTILNYARGAYKEQGKSPNIRQVTLGSGVPTKEIYKLFPKAPGLMIAKIAGIPKPGGCL